MRQPSDLAPFYAYWRLALTDLESANALYWQQKEAAGYAQDERMPVCGFFRKHHSGREGWPANTMIPVAIWLDQPTDPETGELVADERFRIKVGYRILDTAGMDPWKALQVEEIIISNAIQNPVSETAYNHAMTYKTWADDHERAPKTAASRKPVVDVRDERSLF